MRRIGGTSPPLIAARWRRRVLVVVVAAAVTAAVIGGRYEGTSGPGRLDVGASEVLRDWPAASRVLVYLGEPGPLAVGVLLLALLALRVRRSVLFALLAPSAAVAVTFLVLKPLFGRTLGAGLAYPSTHMTGVSALLVAAAVLVTSAQRWSRTARGLVLAGLLSVGVAEAATLSALGYHYATDTVGGAGVAVVVVLSSALLLDALSRPSTARGTGGTGAGSERPLRSSADAEGPEAR